MNAQGYKAAVQQCARVTAGSFGLLLRRLFIRCAAYALLQAASEHTEVDSNGAEKGVCGDHDVDDHIVHLANALQGATGA